MFWCNSGKDINELMEAVLGFIWKTVEDMTPKANIRIFSNQKLWVDTTIRDALRIYTATYNTGVITGNIYVYRAIVHGV